MNQFITKEIILNKSINDQLMCIAGQEIAIPSLGIAVVDIGLCLMNTDLANNPPAAIQTFPVQFMLNSDASFTCIIVIPDDTDPILTPTDLIAFMSNVRPTQQALDNEVNDNAAAMTAAIALGEATSGGSANGLMMPAMVVHHVFKSKAEAKKKAKEEQEKLDKEAAEKETKVEAKGEVKVESSVSKDGIADAKSEVNANLESSSISDQDAFNSMDSSIQDLDEPLEGVAKFESQGARITRLQAEQATKEEARIEKQAEIDKYYKANDKLKAETKEYNEEISSGANREQMLNQQNSEELLKIDVPQVKELDGTSSIGGDTAVNADAQTIIDSANADGAELLQSSGIKVDALGNEIEATEGETMFGDLFAGDLDLLVEVGIDAIEIA